MRVTAVGLGLCGCGGDTSENDAGAGDGDQGSELPEGFGDAPDRNAVAAGEVCARLAVVQCIGERDCCEQPGRDLETCLDDQQHTCEARALADRISLESAAGFDAALAEGVLAEIEALSRSCDPSLTAFSLSADGFGRMFEGTVAAGGNCAPQNPNDRAMAGAALAACRNRQTHACLPSSTMWRCEPVGGADAHCFTDNNCQAGLYCDNPGLSLDAGKCRARKPTGSPCGSFGECEGLACNDGVCAEADAQSAYCYAQ